MVGTVSESKTALELLKALRDKQVVVWNLICVERRLHDSGNSNDAYTVRQVLDSISNNWRTVTDYKGLELVESIWVKDVKP